VDEARLQQNQMRGNISAVAVAVGASVGLLSGVEQNMGPNNDGQPGEAQNLLNLLNNVQENQSNKNDIQANQTSYSQEIQQLDKQEKDLADLETRLKEFQSISPAVLTRPFAIATHSLSPFQFTPMNFFTPGVIALLLQHITITIAALSIVRERRAGMIELFRVSPLKASETLIGKYISYMIFGVFIAAVLGLLLAYGLKVPMLGSWSNFAVVVLLLLFASLGIGFFISLVAATESQAVQYAMIALLLSVFFSGFILDLRYMVGPVRAVSWLLPATYSTILFQGIMLRGSGLILIYVLGLAAIGIILFLFSLILMRRQMAHE
jgi:ABC-2 type transport system permease protein